MLTGARNGGSWLGSRDLPAMGAVFYLLAGWTQWKPQAPTFHLSEAAVNYSMTEVLKVITSHYTFEFTTVSLIANYRGLLTEGKFCNQLHPKLVNYCTKYFMST